METSIVIAIIGGLATIVAAVIALIPWWRSKHRRNTSPRVSGSSLNVNAKLRIAYYKGIQHQFLKFGPLTSRIQPMDGGDTFVVPTTELFHDPEETDQVSNRNRP